MKIRKHKNNQTFKITFATRSPRWTETHLTGDGGRTEKVSLGGEFSPGRFVLAVGSDAPSVLRAFLFGRDASNIHATIKGVSPFFWGGRFVNS